MNEDWKVLGTIPANKRKYRVEELEPNPRYMFFIVAHGKIGNEMTTALKTFDTPWEGMHFHLLEGLFCKITHFYEYFRFVFR